ncbi:MAG: ABC transporter permease, partial [Eubacteriaceae bacterium]
MTLFLGSLQLGLIYSLLAMGIYISFRILNTPDLTAEGSFTLGMAVMTVFVVAGHPFVGIIFA